MSVYVDVLLVINVFMNCIILWLTAVGMAISYKFWRILAASAIGAMQVLTGFWTQLAFLHTAPFKILISFLLVLVAFGFKSIRSLLMLVGVFYVISFFLGGAVIGWFYFWQNSSYFQTTYLTLSSISLQNLLGGTFIGIILITLVIRRIIGRLSRKRSLYQINVGYEGRHVELTSMLDTGNGLYTLIGRKPVIVIERSKIEMVLSEEVIKYFNNTESTLWLAELENCKDNDWLSRVQVIPYTAVGSSSMLLAFRPDNIKVITREGLITKNDVVIAIYNGKLSSDGTYNALLHPALFNNEEVSICA
ncbi:sigma-E processing peptidase SpoIIGA [Dendrosporobacter sp. 1207_IL3150]|uniref:sigma-E processing peptidase SpoIIGA n=1 Tax=Dendrosporobacter sp. 1207_IL3150 TaxID=3084054 RepID=UPI002FD984FA